MTKLVLPIALAVVVAGATVMGAAGDDDGGHGADCGLPQGDEPVDLDPGDFTVRIDNPYWPMEPGTTWRYVETDGDAVEEIVVTVLDETRVIDGVEARVVRDTVTEDGELVEDTYDWYAQDRDGNLWYLGEDTKEYEDGEVASTEGSWEHGVDGALAGIALPGDPVPGCTYRQEYAKGEAEDNGAVLSVDEIVEVPAGRWRGALSTQDTNALEPWVDEHKVYARGIGPVLTLDLAGGRARGELVDVSR